MSLAPEILALDFAALRTFKLVYGLKSFSAAANELGMNTSTISYTIEKVRKAAGDPLFVRQGGGIAPTDHCHKLVESVQRILGESEHFRDSVDFEPSRAVGEISVNTTSYETVLVIPSLVKRLRSEAPGIQLTFRENYRPAEDMLLNGEVDIYLGPQKLSESGIYGIEDINRDQHLCLMDPAHPLASKAKLSLDDLQGANHVHFEPRPGWEQAPRRYARSKGVKLNKFVVTNDATSFGNIVGGTDLLAALPARFAAQFSDRLALVPFDFDTSMAEHMYWTASTHRSKMNQWVRMVIEEEAKRYQLPEVSV